MFLVDEQTLAALNRIQSEMGLKSANLTARALVGMALKVLDEHPPDVSFVRSVVQEARAEARATMLAAVNQALSSGGE